MGRLPAWTMVVALVVGAAGALVVDRVFWDNELKTQLAERDALVAGLNADLETARQGLNDLKTTNAAMRRLIDDTWTDTAVVARSQASSLEKLRAVIARLEALQKSLEQGGRP